MRAFAVLVLLATTVYADPGDAELAEWTTYTVSKNLLSIHASDQ
jgi:hypothetical protein